MSLVIDSSAVIDYLVDPTPPQSLREVLGQEALYAPHLLDFEVVSGLRGLLLAGKNLQSDVNRQLDHFVGLHINRVPLTTALSSLLGFARNFTAYDAAYVVLAQLLDAPLVTADRKFVEARRLGVDVRVVR